MASNAALWWIKASGGVGGVGTEASAVADTTNFADGEIVLFNETPVNSAGGHIFQSEFRIRTSTPENPTVNGQGNDIQDMGLDGIDVQITGMIKDSDVNNNYMTKLMTWINEKKTTTLYTEGRFGLRIDDFPYFNMVPTATYGYVLNDVTFIRDPNKDNKVGFVIILRQGGSSRTWLDAGGYSGE